MRVKDDLDPDITSENNQIEAVTVGYCGKVVELDLCLANKQGLEEVLGPYLKAGHPVDEHHAAEKVDGGVPNPRELGRMLREFARERDIEVPTGTKPGSYYYSADLCEKFALHTGIPYSALPRGKKK